MSLRPCSGVQGLHLLGCLAVVLLVPAPVTRAQAASDPASALDNPALYEQLRGLYDEQREAVGRLREFPLASHRRLAKPFRIDHQRVRAAVTASSSALFGGDRVPDNLDTIAIAADVSPFTAGDWFSMPDGTWSYVLRIETGDAEYLSASVKVLRRLPRAFVIAYTPDAAEIQGPFELVNGPEGNLHIPTIQGPELIIEVRGLPPTWRSAGPPFMLHRLYYRGPALALVPGYQYKPSRPGADDVGPALACSYNDATCSAKSAFKSASLRLKYTKPGWEGKCTGTLLKDFDSSTDIPYILTAGHCSNDGFTLTEAWFWYDSASCNSSTVNGNYQILGSATAPFFRLDRAYYGDETSNVCSFQRDWELWRFNLLSAVNNAPAFLESKSNALPNGTAVYLLHHPDGVLTKYSTGDLSTDHGTSYREYDMNNFNYSEGGSSGAAVIDAADNRIVGIHNCGPGGCTSIVNYDETEIADIASRIAKWVTPSLATPVFYQVASCPATADEDITFFCSFYAQNNGAYTSPDGHIHLSFFDLTSSSDGPRVSFDSGATEFSSTFSRYPAGFSGLNRRDGKTDSSANFLHIEARDTSWTSGEQNSLRVAITPKAGGTFDIGYRAAMQSQNGYYYNTPTTGTNDADQQWPLSTIAVTVTPCPQFTTAVSGNGTITVSTAANCTSSAGKYRRNTVIALTANPGSNQQFSSWSGTGGTFSSATSLTTSFTITGNATVTATFTSLAETVTTSSTPSGPGSGSPNVNYTFSTGNSSSSLGHSVQYQFDWGDGQVSGWLPVGTTSASHAWSSAGTYTVRTQARCATHTGVVSNQSPASSMTISQPSESVSTPSTPSGPGSGSPNVSYTFSTGGSISTLGHSVQYQFDWGDGQFSGWLPAGTTSASHAWSSGGTYTVRAQARCATHTGVASSQSSGSSISIAQPTESVSAPSTPSGPSAGTPGISYSYSTGGASSSLGHSVQYQFDWGDGQFSGWLPVGTVSASHAWASQNTYTIRAQARCASDTSAVSNTSPALSVAIAEGSPSELIVNGGFELATATGNNAPGWTVLPSDGSGHTLIIKNGPAPHAGTTYAAMGGTNNTEYDWLLQTVSIPQSAASPALTLWASVTTQEGLDDEPFDYLFVVLYDLNGNYLDTLGQVTNQDANRSNNTAGNYFKVGPIDLASYRGTSVQVAVIVQTDSILPTTFLVDDVSLTTSSQIDQAPATTVTAPASGATVAGTVNVVATASDDVGVTSLELYIDDALNASTNATSLTYPWNTAQTPNGAHQIFSRAYDGAGHVSTSSTVTVTVSNGALGVPGNVVATTTSSFDVNVSWNGVTGAASYQIFRSTGAGYSLAGTSQSNQFTDVGRTPNTTYLYQVRAVDAVGNVGQPSNTDPATTILFTDDPLVTFSTRVKALHFTELRSAVNAFRMAAGLAPATFSDALTSGVGVRAVHLNELRTSLNQARTALGLAALVFTSPAITAGVTPIRGADVMEIRGGVK